MTSAYLYQKFEYIDHTRNDANIEVRITFNWYPGQPERIHYNEHDHPATSAQREYVTAEREVADGGWVPIADTEWLNEWCIAAFEAADDDELVRALPEREDC